MIRRPPRSTLFPSRRSSDLFEAPARIVAIQKLGGGVEFGLCEAAAWLQNLDRKSTRLNSSHTVISYAVFCLKKKKNKDRQNIQLASNEKRSCHHHRITRR